MSTASKSGGGQAHGHGHGHDHHHDDEFDRGLSYDLPVFARRRMIRLLAGASMVPLVAACSSDDSASGSASDPASSGSSSSSSSSGTSGADCEVIPSETAGPYPGDGSNGPNVLEDSGVVRRDLTKSFGSSSGVAEGIPLTITLTVVDQSSGCDAPKKGAAVYLWHCDREGRYSLYSDSVTEENYLRGVQETDAEGRLTFTSIFPGCYPGRWPHIHFEVYDSLDDATATRDIAVTSQLAFPKDVCDTVYATDGYGDSVQNLGELSLETDMIFRDGYDQQLATVEGSTDKGYTATLTVAV